MISNEKQFVNILKKRYNNRIIVLGRDGQIRSNNTATEFADEELTDELK